MTCDTTSPESEIHLRVTLSQWQKQAAKIFLLNKLAHCSVTLAGRCGRQVRVSILPLSQKTWGSVVYKEQRFTWLIVMEVEVQDQGAVSAEGPVLHHSMIEQTEKTGDKRDFTLSHPMATGTNSLSCERH